MNNELDLLKEELEKLKFENEHLKHELKVYELSMLPDATLEEYFVEQYTKMHEAALKARLDDVDKSIISVNFEISYLEEQIYKVEQLEASIKVAEETLKGLKANEEILKAKLDECHNNYDSLYEDSKNKQNILKNATLGYYKTILNSLCEPIDNDLVCANIAFVLEQLNKCLYDIVLDCRTLNFKVNELQKSYELAQDEYDALISEMNELNKLNDERAKYNSVEEYRLDIIDLKCEISQLEDLKKELSKTFDSIKVKNVEDIISSIKYQKLIEKQNKDISLDIEAKINSYVESLKSQDTLKNLKIAKQIEIYTLKKETALYTKKVTSLNKLLKLEDDMHKAYQEASSSIDVLLDFIDQANLAILENTAYEKISKDYANLQNTEHELTAQFNIISDQANNVLNKRQEAVLTAAKEDELKTLNSSLTAVNKEKQRLVEELRDVRDKISAIEKEPANLKLISVLREKDFAQTHLPKMYANLRTLKVKLVTIKQEINDLNSEIEAFKPLLKRIEELENEVND